MQQEPNFGVILVNLGTPAEPTTKAVRDYLREFLSDIRVVDAPRWFWWLALHGFILRFRPKRLAKLYQAIWTEQGSPLLKFSRALTKAVAANLKQKSGMDIPVELAMVYGKPSFTEASKRFREKGIKKLLVVPLYPQYSATTTAAAFDAFAKQIAQCPDMPELMWVRNYYDDPRFIGALASSVTAHQTEHGKPEMLVMSFHGIPERYETQGDPYPTECRKTATALAKKLGLEEHQWVATFQSRFGREEWVKPYTDHTVTTLAEKGIKEIAIISPAFAVDCLETLEEIKDQVKATYLEAGGSKFHYIPCLNDSPEHVEFFSDLIIEKSNAWKT